MKKTDSKLFKLFARTFIVLLLILLKFNSLYAQIDSSYYEIQTNENGDPIYFKHQIIIAFSPDLLSKTIIDNKEFVHGKLIDFFNQEAIYLASSIGLWNDEIANSPTSKIYSFLDSDDTLSLTRSGETIEIPKYWATLLVYWPLRDPTPILQVCDSLNKFYPIIEFAHPNYLYFKNSVPNDPLYSNYQNNLQYNPFNGFPDGHINIENAWDIETGSSSIKLGIFDDPIMYNHEDFGGGTLTTSKIKGGKVYYTNPTGKPVDISAFSLSLVTENHGTKVAGVAAAIRNNEKGIAGVAGGDFTQRNTGVSLYTFGIFGTGAMYCGDADASAAITEAANYILQPDGTYTGYGLDIQNHSWGGIPRSSNVGRAIKGAARNQCVVVCSRGNVPNDINKEFGTDEDNYPATYNDEWVISVGASGSNKYRLNIKDNNLTGPDLWSSMYGKAMDVIAPGDWNYVPTLVDYNIQSTKSGNVCFGNDYCEFNGTSASAPHVSGLAGLLLSKYRPANGFYERLQPEDVENLIEKYAEHWAPGPSFYNDDQGWGLINPDNTLDKVKNNQYQVYHFTNGWPRTETNMGNITITVPSPTAGNPGLFGLTAGNYVVEKWKMVETYTNTFGSSEQILGYWPRLNATNGLKDFGSNSLTDDEHATYVFTQTGNVLSVTATTFAYKNTSTGLWLNLDKSKIKTAYSVHTFDPTKSAVNEVNLSKIELKLYPNPASNKIMIDLENNKVETIEVFDINGKNQTISYLINSKTVVLNTQQLANGIYICKTMLTNGGIAINKIIISH
jgi:hypothetical protein